MYQLYCKQNSTVRSIIISVLFIISTATLFFGVYSLIEHKSPENMASFNMLAGGFITYFKYHLLVLSGALGCTFSLLLSGQGQNKCINK